MTGQLTAHCSTTERLTNNRLKEADSHSMDQHMTKQKLVRHSFFFFFLFHIEYSD